MKEVILALFFIVAVLAYVARLSGRLIPGTGWRSRPLTSSSR
jgi:hypothetical protein